jgi:hypothetical protein
LVAAGRKEEAMQILKSAAKMNRNTLPEGVVVNTQSIVSITFIVV